MSSCSSRGRVRRGGEGAAHLGQGAVDTMGIVF